MHGGLAARRAHGHHPRRADPRRARELRRRRVLSRGSRRAASTGIRCRITILDSHSPRHSASIRRRCSPATSPSGMARPWQGDFMLCGGPQSGRWRIDLTSWWPAARPIGIYPFDDPTNKRALDARRRVFACRTWSRTGTSSASSSIRGLDRPVETEKTNVCKSCFFITNRSEISKDEAQALMIRRVHPGRLLRRRQGLAPSALSITIAESADPAHCRRSRLRSRPRPRPA